MAKMIDKNADSDHEVTIENYIKMRVRAGGKEGTDSVHIVNELKAMKNGEGNRIYTDREIDDAITGLLGKGDIKHK